MPAHQLAAAIDAARRDIDLDIVARGVWAALGAGQLTDDEAEALSVRIEAKRDVRAAGRATVAQERRRLTTVPPILSSPPAVTPGARPRTLFAQARQVPADRAASRARRRLLAASGPLPPKLAAHFSTGELATLRLIAEEVAARAVCGLTYGELAARAGVGRSTVKRALHQARRLGLVTVEERRRPGRKNLASLVRIVSAEWRAWISHRLFREGRQPHGGGVQSWTTTDKKIYPRSGQGRRAAPSTSSTSWSCRRQRAWTALDKP